MATTETLMLGFASLPLSLAHTKISLSLASTPVSAVNCPSISINLLNHRRASFHGLDNGTSLANLPVTVTFLSQEITKSFPFRVVDRDFGFEMLLGSELE